MPLLYLMRHAEAEKHPDQDDGHLFSVGDTPLSETGVAEARRMAQLLADVDLDAVVASPARRCQETAKLVAAPHNREVATDERLWEVPYGRPGDDYQRVLSTILQVAKRLRDEKDPELPGGERWQAVTGRYRQALEEIVADHQRVLVVGHGAQNRAYLSHVLSMDPHRLFSLEQDHGCVNVLAYDQQRATVVKLNVTVPALRSDVAGLQG